MFFFSYKFSFISYNKIYEKKIQFFSILLMVDGLVCFETTQKKIRKKKKERSEMFFFYWSFLYFNDVKLRKKYCRLYLCIEHLSNFFF